MHKSIKANWTLNSASVKMEGISKLVLILATVTTTLGAPSYENKTYEDRIISGSYARQGQFPYIVFIEKSGQFQCGGSILTPKWIVSAAHCFYRYMAYEFVVYAGLLNQDQRNQDRNVQRKPVQQFYIHQQYQQGNNFPNDIAMVQLQSPLQYTSSVGNINLPRINSELYGSPGVTIGWGLTEAGQNSNILKYYTEPVLNSIDCQQAILEVGKVVKTLQTHICTDSKTFPRQASCKGDSGGPLVQNNNILVGVVSWAIEGCTMGPTVYTKVSSYLDFINLYIHQ